MRLIEPGTAAPAFSLPDQSGKVHRLSEYRGQPVVVYFYPKDDTSVCTTEACAFEAALKDFHKLSVPVIGVSPDSRESHAAFARKHGLTFPLLSDEPPVGGAPKVAEAFGVWAEKSMYGRKYMGVVRTTYLIDGGGRVYRRWDSVKVKGHVEAVLAAIEELRTGVSAPESTKMSRGGAVSRKVQAKRAAGKSPSRRGNPSKPGGAVTKRQRAR